MLFNLSYSKLAGILFLILSFSTFANSQCTTVVSASNGDYDVNITLDPIEIIAPSNCPSGYNYNVKMNYNVNFTGNNPPGSLWTLNAYIDCGANMDNFFYLPTTGGAGSSNTTSNPWRNVSDCATATPPSLSCNSIDIDIHGPNIALQTITCPVAYLLPVEMLSFTIAKKDGNVEIQWVTASEINNDYFSVERSINGIDWLVLSKITGAGTSDAVNDYSFTDRNPVLGTSYYRVKQTDLDGQFTYTEARSMLFGSNTEATRVYPNPTSGRLTVSNFDSKFDEITMVDLLGRDVLQDVILIGENENEFTLDTSHLPNGMYSLVSKNTTVRFLKN